jgi:hypothetical protein
LDRWVQTQVAADIQCILPDIFYPTYFTREVHGEKYLQEGLVDASGLVHVLKVSMGSEKNIMEVY